MRAPPYRPEHRFSLVSSTHSYRCGGFLACGPLSRPRTQRNLAPVYDLSHARLRRMSGHKFTQAELAETAAGLQRLLAAIEAGVVTADSGTVARLQGAVAALEALAGTPDDQGVVP